MKVLLLFANAFPYGSWEPYLESEIEHYAEFDRVEIFSLSVRADQAKHRRHVPAGNFGVHPIAFRSRAFYAVRAARVLADRALYVEVLHLARARRLSLGRFVQLLVFLSRAHFEASEVSRIVKQEGYSNSDELILYAYRFAYQPYLVNLVGRSLPQRLVSVARAHGGDLYESVAPNGYIPLREAVAGGVDYVFPVSQHGESYLISRLPRLLGRIEVSNLGTQDRGIGPIPESSEETRILTCSNLVRVKRLDRLVDALAISDPDQRIRWVHYGEGALADEIVSDAKRKLGHHVSMEFRGAISNTDLLDVYRHEPFHALVNVSESEGLPVSMMEASSFGIPIIATNVGGVSEIVEDGVNGVLLNASPTPREILAAIQSIGRQDMNRSTDMRHAARRVWQARFDASKNYSGFASRLIGLLDAKRTLR